MFRELPNYLRAYRKRARLSQDDVAFLVGCRSGTEISQHERFKRLPSLRTAVAYEVIFHASLRTLLAGFYKSVEKETEGRARLLAVRLARKARSSPDSLSGRRSTSSDPTKEV